MEGTGKMWREYDCIVWIRQSHAHILMLLELYILEPFYKKLSISNITLNKYNEQNNFY